MVSENGRNLQSIRVTQVSGISPSSMRKSLESLAGRDILCQAESNGEISFRFEARFSPAGFISLICKNREIFLCQESCIYWVPLNNRRNHY